ncbi:MAG: hypothetical protein Q8R92_20230 [Deltaproteobacteria bacterium]|nr:hypothetical protein [Deltaproteobacteria bacterium]
MDVTREQSEAHHRAVRAEMAELMQGVRQRQAQASAPAAERRPTEAELKAQFDADVQALKASREAARLAAIDNMAAELEAASREVGGWHVVET